MSAAKKTAKTAQTTAKTPAQASVTARRKAQGPTPSVGDARNQAGELLAGQTPAPGTPSTAVEPEKPGKSKQVQLSDTQRRGTVPKGKEGQKNEAQVAAPRSGGRRIPDPLEPVTDLQGEGPTHPPDLADNNDGGPQWPRSGVRSNPTDLTTMSDEMALDQISREVYANVLMKWRRDERASSESRPRIIEAIEGRLLHVQGPPVPVA